MADDATAQLLKDIKGQLTAADADKIALVGKMDNTIALIANYYQVLSGLIPLIVNALRTPGPSDSEVLREVQLKVEELLNEVGAIESEIKMLNLADMERAPDGNLVTLAIEGPNGQDVDPKAFFDGAEQVANALKDDEVYWFRPFLKD